MELDTVLTYGALGLILLIALYMANATVRFYKLFGRSMSEGIRHLASVEARLKSIPESVLSLKRDLQSIPESVLSLKRDLQQLAEHLREIEGELKKLEERSEKIARDVAHRRRES